ncbi:MAG: Rpn family recombination-promoting nuclease/putative transposase [Zoogloeaceae bacterium]|jgi:predicted transposase/invertase (TIGR01784 family)|nr:Rpn family recombination-promoting nuclease/putative transposase [Zoogloeaceae bacterium]
MPSDYLPPSADIIFRRLFGRQKNAHNILLPFLRAAFPLPGDEYAKIIITDPESKDENIAAKSIRFDVCVQTASGRLIDIEIQRQSHDAIRERFLYYAARLYAGQVKTGDNYRGLRPAVCIVIADFQMVDNADYHNQYQMRNAKDNTLFSDYLAVHVLELPKLPREANEDPLWPWLGFLKAHEKEEIDMLAQQYPELKPAVVELAVLSQDDRTRLIYEAQAKAESEFATRYGSGIRDIARRMLAKGLDTELIIETTGITEYEMKRILAERQGIK